MAAVEREEKGLVGEKAPKEHGGVQGLVGPRGSEDAKGPPGGPAVEREEKGSVGPRGPEDAKGPPGGPAEDIKLTRISIPSSVEGKQAHFLLNPKGELYAKGEGGFSGIILTDDWLLVATGVTYVRTVGTDLLGDLEDNNRFSISATGDPSGTMGATRGLKEPTPGLVAESGL